jgi:hypothetical protein
MKTIYTLIAVALLSLPVRAEDAPPEVVQVCASFFNQLRDGKVSDAYALLLRGSKIGDKLEEVTKLQDRTHEMIQGYGPIRGHELVSTDFCGKNLCRVTYLTRSDNVPVRWRITFYRPADQWRVFNLQLDDAVMEFFGK